MDEPRYVRDLGLEESVIFNGVAGFRSEGLKQKHLHSFAFANKSLGITIPTSHHKMSVLEMKESKGYYWAHAAYFLLGNKAHGFPMWKQLQEQINSHKEEIQCFQHISQERKGHIFQGIGAIKSTYLERNIDTFLLDDWVLIQLPFQPSLLHQWLSVVLLKLNKFDEVFKATFTLYPIPHDLYRIVSTVNQLLKVAHTNVALLFDFLQAQTENELEISLKSPEDISGYVSKIIRFLNYAQNSEQMKVLEAVAEHVKAEWNPRANGWSIFLRKRELAMDKRNYMHNLNFWIQPARNLKIFGQSGEYTGDWDISDDDSVFTKVNIQNFERRFWDGAVKDEFKPVNLIAIQRDSITLYKFLYNINKESLRERSLKSIRACDQGLLTMTLHSKAKIDRLQSIVATKKYFNVLFNLKHFDLYAEDRTIVSQEDLVMYCHLFRVESSNWGYRDSLREIMLDVGEPITKCPSIEEAPRAIALKFEERIKKIVIGAIASHYTATDFEKEKDEVLRDWHVVQYLLPCFVVSYLDLCESTIPAPLEQKEWYLRFIHELISTYEIDGIRRSSEKNILDDVRKSSALRDSVKENGSDKLVQKFEKITSAFFAELNGEHDAMTNLKNRCVYFDVLYEVLIWRNKSDRPADLAKKPCLYWNWLMWDFFKRMEKALRVLKENNESYGRKILNIRKFL